MDKLRNKMDEYVHLVYSITKDFPKDELYGSVSQLRRASLSVVLNFVEGFARQRNPVKKNFWEISYGSLKESQYLLTFGDKEKYIKNTQAFVRALKLGEEIGAMLWTALKPLNTQALEHPNK